MALDPLAPLKFGIRVGIGVLRWELRVIELVLGLDEPEPDAVIFAEPEPEPVFTPEPAPEPPPARRPVARPPVEPVESVPVPEPEPPPVPPEPEPDAPVHIDTEPELVAEFSEPGAEEGAGPEIHVAEPWDGYGRMRVADIRDRVAVAGAEELAVAQLYEVTHRRRRSVLDAVERRSKQLANAPR
jgi:hypothetical protein